jgi:hypothetical protein
MPTKAKSKATFSKYKVSVCILLDNQQVIDAYGSQYCCTLRKKIIDLYKQHIDDVVKHRTTIKNDLVQIQDDNSTETSSETSEVVLDIDINSLEPGDTIHQGNSIQTDNTDHKTLLSKYNALLISHTSLSCEVKLLRQELDRVWTLTNKLAAK